MIELRYAVGQALRARRRKLRITQTQLAKMIGADQATISRLERASLRVTFDYAVYALIALNCSDAEIAMAINASLRPDVHVLRKRMSRRLVVRAQPGFRLRESERKSTVRAGGAAQLSSGGPAFPSSRARAAAIPGRRSATEK